MVNGIMAKSALPGAAQCCSGLVQKSSQAAVTPGCFIDFYCGNSGVVLVGGGDGVPRGRLAVLLHILVTLTPMPHPSLLLFSSGSLVLLQAVINKKEFSGILVTPFWRRGKDVCVGGGVGWKGSSDFCH